MISSQDKATIISWAKKFAIKEVYVFGSSLEHGREAHDIDLAVRGISPTVFFDFYGKLLRHLSKPVDVVNMSKPSRFTHFIEQQAVKIYG